MLHCTNTSKYRILQSVPRIHGHTAIIPVLNSSSSALNLSRLVAKRFRLSSLRTFAVNVGPFQRNLMDVYGIDNPANEIQCAVSSVHCGAVHYALRKESG